jgi:hypothetical protein
MKSFTVTVRMFAALLCAAGFAACHTGSASTLVGASTMTALALGTSAAERAACNPRTGLCELQPCRNQCSASEHCEATFTGDKCMPGAPTGVESVAKSSSKQNMPVGTPTALPSINGGEPTIVPAAEQVPPNSK